MIKPLGPEFCWATGIENSFIPQARPGFRSMDEYALTQHYQHWRADIDHAAALGVGAIRWGIPWYRVQPAPEQWDWRWVDAVLDYIVNVKGLIPILDLMHYGTPLWLDNSFLNSRYPEAVARYAGVVADRYQSLVHYYTPLNEPTVNAEWAGYRNEWPPHLTGDDGYVKVLMALARGIVLTVHALQAAQPTMQTVQVEAVRQHWAAPDGPQPQVAYIDAHQYLCFDLVTGRVDEAYPLREYLHTHGVTAAELAWFRRNAVRFDILGANFYPWSYGEVVRRKDGRFTWRYRRVPGAAIGDVLRSAYARYGMPIMVTETSLRGNLAQRARWLDETVQSVADLRRAGLPIIGYTWFPLFSMIDWKYRTGRRPVADYLLHLGLYDAAFDADGTLVRQATPLVARYQQHIATPMPAVGDSMLATAR
jgi:beta-glucosidase/6-phospho-beta-glucosidase/beta-galactosidase